MSQAELDGRIQGFGVGRNRIQFVLHSLRTYLILWDLLSPTFNHQTCEILGISLLTSELQHIVDLYGCKVGLWPKSYLRRGVGGAALVGCMFPVK